MIPMKMHDDGILEARSYEKPKIRLVRGTFWDTLVFYTNFMKLRCFIIACLAVLLNLLLLDMLASPGAPLWTFGLVGLLGGLAVQVTVCVVDLYLAIRYETWHWNDGICRSTGKPWLEISEDGNSYHRVCYRSESESLRLTYIEPTV